MGLTIDTGLAPSAYGNAGISTPATAPAPEPEPAKATPVAVTQPVAENQATELAKVREPVKKPEAAAAKNRDAVTISYDSQAGVNVFKSFDSKGYVVTQVPPAQLLKTMELEGKTQEEIKGLVINTKV